MAALQVGTPIVPDPDRKGKVESGIGHTQKTPLKGMRFESLEEAQAYLDRWEERWADTRNDGTTKRQVAAMFAEEKPHLLPLPLEPFRYYEYGKRVVNLERLRGGQGSLLQFAARMDRPFSERAFACYCLQRNKFSGANCAELRPANWLLRSKRACRLPTSRQALTTPEKEVLPCKLSAV